MDTPLNNIILETFDKISNENGLNEESKNMLLRIINKLATNDINVVDLDERINHLISNMRNTGEEENVNFVQSDIEDLE